MSNAIETNQLTKRFGDVLAVDAIDLRVGTGEIYGFLGLNGIESVYLGSLAILQRIINLEESS